MKDKKEGFVESSLDIESPKKMRSQILALNFFPIIGISFGLILGGQYLTISCIIVLSLITEYIYVVAKTKNNNKKSIIRAQLCVSTSVCINNLLLAILLYGMYSGFSWKIAILFIPPFLTTIFTLLLSHNSKRKENYEDKKKVNLNNVKTLAGSTTIFTYTFLKTRDISIEQNTALMLVIIAVLIFSSLGALGIVVDYTKIYHLNEQCQTVSKKI